MTSRQNGQISHEQEQELLGELEAELEGAHHEGVHHEDELEAALHEDEFGHHETAHHEYEHPEVGHHEHGFHEHGFHELHELHELHEGEQFFGKLRKLARGVGRFVSKAAPILKSVARIALPMVATAVGGPLGGIVGKVASQALGEDELEGEDELGGLHEDELEAALHEDELGGLHEAGGHHEHGFNEALPELGGHHEALHETHHEAHHEVVAEMLAESAAGAHHEAEAEAMAGAAVVATLTAADRAALRRLLPHLVRGVAVLTRILRQRRITRPAVRTVPTIFRQTVGVLRRRLASGQPVGRRLAGQVLATTTRRMLTNPRVCGTAIVRNLRANLRAGRGGSVIG